MVCGIGGKIWSLVRESILKVNVERVDVNYTDQIILLLSPKPTTKITAQRVVVRYINDHAKKESLLIISGCWISI